MEIIEEVNQGQVKWRGRKSKEKESSGKGEKRESREGGKRDCVGGGGGRHYTLRQTARCIKRIQGNYLGGKTCLSLVSPPGSGELLTDGFHKNSSEALTAPYSIYLPAR